MKVSLIISCLSAFQPRSVSPNITAIASTASLITVGGLGKVRTSVNCCFLIDFTAKTYRRMTTSGLEKLNAKHSNLENFIHNFRFVGKQNIHVVTDPAVLPVLQVPP